MNSSTPIPEITRDLRVIVLRRRSRNDFHGTIGKPKAFVGSIEDGIVSKFPLDEALAKSRKKQKRTSPRKSKAITGRKVTYTTGITGYDLFLADVYGVRLFTVNGSSETDTGAAWTNLPVKHKMDYERRAGLKEREIHNGKGNTTPDYVDSVDM